VDIQVTKRNNIAVTTLLLLTPPNESMVAWNVQRWEIQWGQATRYKNLIPQRIWFCCICSWGSIFSARKKISLESVPDQEPY